VGVIDMVITDMGVFEITPNGLKLLELAPGVTVAEVQEHTAVKLDVSAVA
jgi:3-oxoacid CoA-transferase subunit B